MNDAAPKPRRPLRRNCSIYRVHYDLPKEDQDMARPLVMPTDSLEIQAYEKQVAGHQTTCDKRYLGLLQCNNGTILKPILKECQRREVHFYERLANTKDPDLLELRKFAPQYFGCKKFTYNGHEQEYIILEDIVEKMLEPCIMDVKIGKRTWDPLATEDKIQKEKTKYAPCKEEFGFCIPGYQVYRLDTGRLLKFGKDHGKRLRGTAVKDALRKFLNGPEGLCRALVLQVLAALWRVQRWAARARPLALCSASVLLAYDAAKLRACCGDSGLREAAPCRASRARRSSAPCVPGASFSGQLSPSGPRYSKLRAVPLAPLAEPAPPAIPPSPWSEALDRLNLNHSFDHNYEDKLSKIKMNYRALLSQLGEEDRGRQWSAVRLIDFAHAFQLDDELVDDNFRAGIDGFVAMLEELLAETDDQAF